MKDRLLIDTSAWIMSFRKAGHEELKRRIINALDGDSVLTSEIIVLELLQGCRDRREYEAMKSRLEAIELLAMNDAVWQMAYETGYALRRAGIAVPTVDIIIASLVKAHGCALLHHDRHFRSLAKKMGIKAIDFLG